MTIGRCAGCGLTNPSCKTVDKHVMTCPEYLTLYRTEPARALKPTDEYVRWKANEGSADNLADAKDEARTERIAGLRANDKARLERYNESYATHRASSVDTEDDPSGSGTHAPKLHERHITTSVPGLDLSTLT
jgi:hypothetical protein